MPTGRATAPRPAHSPLGASGAERWMNCPGSAALLRELLLPETEEADFLKEGHAGHEAAAKCLNEGLDAWEIMGTWANGVVIDDDLANAIQVYLDTVRETIANAEVHWVEFGISSPVHPEFYGTLDFGAVVRGIALTKFLDITDLKMGQGMVVECEDNPQLMYYAFGPIEAHPEWADDMPVRIRVVQPRIEWHPDGVVRAWWTTVGEIREWVHDTLVPAMLRAEYDLTLEAGPWCRFCPAKLACPLLTGLFRAAAVHNPQVVPHLSNEQLGRDYLLREAVKFYLNAQDKEAYRRLMLGEDVPGTKLVQKKANRILPPKAIAEAKLVFGPDLMNPPEPKSPAELEKLSPFAAEWVKEHAYSPDTGLTVAAAGDRRRAVKVQSTAKKFGDLAAALEETTT